MYLKHFRANRKQFSHNSSNTTRKDVRSLGHEEIRSKRILNCRGWKSNISHLFLYLWNEENLYLSQPEFDRIKFDLGKEQIVLIRGLLENISFGLIIWHPHHTSCKFSTHQQSLSPNDNNNKTPTAYRILRHKVVESLHLKGLN